MSSQKGDTLQRSRTWREPRKRKLNQNQNEKEIGGLFRAMRALEIEKNCHCQDTVSRYCLATVYGCSTQTKVDKLD